MTTDAVTGRPPLLREQVHAAVLRHPGRTTHELGGITGLSSAQVSYAIQSARWCFVANYVPGEPGARWTVNQYHALPKARWSR